MTQLLAILSLLAAMASPATLPVAGSLPRRAAATAGLDAPFPGPPKPVPALASASPDAAPAPLDAGSLAEATAPGLVTALPALGALAVLGVIALLLSRRRAGSGRRLVQVLETTSLGPKRQLVVARMGDQLLLLGASESGITLLSTQPAAAGEVSSAVAGAVEPRQPAGQVPPGNLISLWSRILGRRRAPARPSFDDLLLETTDDLELRRKLASGRPGRVA